MEDLYSIKRKLETYKKMRQMAEAMKLAAITSYSSLSKKTLLVKNCLAKINEMTASLLHRFDELKDAKNVSGFFENTTSNRSLVIIIGATKELGSGCAGMLKSFLPRVVNPTAEHPIDFFLLGKSGRKALVSQSFSEDSYRIIQEIKDFAFHDISATVNTITSFICEKAPMYRACTIINMRFKSLFSHHRNNKIILPIVSNQEIKEILKFNKEIKNNNYIWEQDIYEIGNILKTKLVWGSLLYEIIESLTAENASRYISMDKAVTNADKCIDEISLKMNKARQVTITKQITEISCYTDL